MRRHALALATRFVATCATSSIAFAYEAEPFTTLFQFAWAGRSPDNRPRTTDIPREVVTYRTVPGTIIVSTNERRLYYVLGNGEAIRYGVGVGRPGFEWSGSKYIAHKTEWPDWMPPPQMLRWHPDLPRQMADGVSNPLGVRAMYLSDTLYGIHGSNEPGTNGQAVSSGCIRMTNEDVIDLYDRVRVGTRVVVTR